MGSTYEYLMSSLPDLSFLNTEEAKKKVLGLLSKYVGAGAEGYTAAEMLDREAGKFLPTNAFATFQKLRLRNIHEAEFQQSRSKVLATFSAMTFALKKELKIWRIAKQEGRSPSSRIAAIVGEGTPLEKEVRIIQYQWEQLEELTAGHYADIEAVFAYKLKLLLLERWWSFDTEQGWAKFSQLTTKQ